MDIMEKIGKATSNTCKVTVTKTTKMAQRAKLRMYINECKDIIEEEYKKMGKKVYEKHIREEDIDIKQDLQEECRKIDKCSNEIEKSIEHMLILKNMKKCPKCYTEISIDYNFCPNCGKNQNGEKSRAEKIVDKLQKENISKDNKNEEEIVIEEKSNNSEE